MESVLDRRPHKSGVCPQPLEGMPDKSSPGVWVGFTDEELVALGDIRQKANKAARATHGGGGVVSAFHDSFSAPEVARS